MSVVTTWVSGVYHLLHMCHVHSYIGIKFWESECFLNFYFKLRCTCCVVHSDFGLKGYDNFYSSRWHNGSCKSRKHVSPKRQYSPTRLNVVETQCTSPSQAPNIFQTTLFWNALSLCSYLNVRHQVAPTKNKRQIYKISCYFV